MCKKNIFMILLIIMGISINSCSVHSNTASKIVGTWQRLDRNGNKIQIMFGNDSLYKIAFYSINLSFTGTYSISDKTVRIVDKYCGTGLPGVFNFVIDKKNILHFAALDDSLCDRKKILTDGDWRLEEKND